MIITVKRKRKHKEEGACNMTVTNITNVEKFFRTIDQCEGKVELVTEQGDRFNLKSTLSQYVSFVRFLSNCTVPAVQIVTTNARDSQKIMKYMMNN